MNVASVAYNCKYKNLSMSRDQKVMTLLPQWRNALPTSITWLLLLPKFDISSPTVTQDKEICHVIVSY